MSNPQAPDDPFAARPEQQPGEPVPPPAAPGYGQPGYGQQGYGQPPAYGAPSPASPPYGSSYGAPAYGQPSPSGGQPPVPPYPGAAQYPAAPGYGAYPAASYGYAVPYPKNSLGIWALVLGIASFALSCFFLTGIPAIILGRQGQRAADEGLANNRSLSTAGIVLGWVAVGLSLVVVAVLVIGLLVAGTSWLDYRS